MQNEQLGVSADTDMLFAFPLADGKWILRQGSLSAVDGYHHKIAFPGFETRSGEGFGITASYHVVQNLRSGDGRVKGDVTRMDVVNGRLAQMKIVAPDAQLLIEG